MNGDPNVLTKVLNFSLSGKGAHVEAKAVFDGIDWNLAGVRPKGVKHSIFQLLNHMVYWQEWALQWLENKKPKIPSRASASWTGSVAPASQEEWDEAVKRFNRVLAELNRQSGLGDLFLRRGRQKSRLEMFQTIASHNSYHIGQVVLLRQMLQSWPPPSGGLTW